MKTSALSSLFNTPDFFYLNSGVTRVLKSHGFAVRLTVFRAISRSHDETQKYLSEQIHKPMEYTFLEYFQFCFVKFLTRHRPQNGDGQNTDPQSMDCRCLTANGKNETFAVCL